MARRLAISEVEVKLIRPYHGIAAVASCVLWEALYIGQIGICPRPNGDIRLSFPRKKNVDICVPIDDALTKGLKHIIEAKYRHVLDNPLEQA